MCEARVWNMFRQVAAESDFENEYLDYVKGENLTNRMLDKTKGKNLTERYFLVYAWTL